LVGGFAGVDGGDHRDPPILVEAEAEEVAAEEVVAREVAASFGSWAEVERADRRSVRSEGRLVRRKKNIQSRPR